MKKIFAAFSLSVIIFAVCLTSNTDRTSVNNADKNIDSISEAVQPNGTNVNEPGFPRI